MSNQYHFIGIGGIGMGAIASLLLSKGHRVSGSDVQENKITQRLRKEGALIHIGHTAENVEGANVVIYSSAIKKDNPEFLKARHLRLPIIKRAELLADLMREHIGITIAGAHGKTTTTAMISHLLTHAGLNPTTAVGGIVNNFQTNASLGTGRYFVSEVDESDGSFLFFAPKYSIITNIDFEHVDYYHNWDNILKAYHQFMEKASIEGCNIIYGGDERLQKLSKEVNRFSQTYGFSPDDDVYAKNIRTEAMTSIFECYHENKCLGQIKINVPGTHNILNALACVSLGLKISIPFDVIASSLENYRGVQRRFQLKGDVGGIMVVDDYAHHPTEIRATLQAAQKVKKKRIIAIFQPHRYTRLSSLQDEFAQSLLDCDSLIVTDVYAASEAPILGVSSENLVAQIQKISDKPVVYLKKDMIIEYILKNISSGDLILTMGAGDITGVSEKIVEVLKNHLVEKNSS